MNLKRGTEVEEPYLQNWETSPPEEPSEKHRSTDPPESGICFAGRPAAARPGESTRRGCGPGRVGRVSSGTHFSLTVPTMPQGPQPVACSEHTESGGRGCARRVSVRASQPAQAQLEQSSFFSHWGQASLSGTLVRPHLAAQIQQAETGPHCCQL